MTTFIFIVICELTGILGSFFTRVSIPTWYVKLQKPFFGPPNWLFGPVWTVLYFCMGVSGAMLWQARQTSPAAKTALIFFFTQLVLNALWTPLFFGAKQLGWAFVEIVCMWLAIAATTFFAFKVRPVAGYLLLPYLAWVAFASVLNFSLWKLNK